jgi:hypothetical protein
MWLTIILTSNFFATKFTDVVPLSEILRWYKCFEFVAGVATVPTDVKIMIRVVNLKPSCRNVMTKQANISLKYIIMRNKICVFPLVTDVME